MTQDVINRADVTLDLTGSTCPGPILGVKKMINELALGEVLLLISDCPGTQDDLYAWAERTGNRVIRSEPLTAGATGYYVQRGRPRQPSAQVTLDMRGFVCPGPVVEAHRVLHRMGAGEILRLMSDCPGAMADVTDWARVTGTRLVDVVELGAHEWEFYLAKP